MTCPYCHSNNTHSYYSAKNMPIILAACSEDLLKQMKIRDFQASLCHDCGLGFNADVLDDEDLKLIYDNYLYISPMNNIGHTKYYGMLDTIESFVSPEQKVVEIGCSEGYILYNLQKRGFTNLLGIEPGPQSKSVEELGIEVMKNYFDLNTFKSGEIDAFVLMHVFEHFPDPFTILEAMKKQLSEDGKIIIEVPNFYGYHHEHLFFYNSPFMHRLAKEKGLKIIDEAIDTTKFILRIVLTHSENKNYKEVAQSVTKEDIIKTADELKRTFEQKVKEANELLEGKKEIYWWGAGSASVIFLNQIKAEILENITLHIIDGDKAKWNSFIPGIEVKVSAFTDLEGREIEELVIASSFYNEIQETLKKHNIKAKNIAIFE